MAARSAVGQRAVGLVNASADTLRHPCRGVDRDRHLSWDGCFNARDLGGLPAGSGATRWGAVVRADALDGLTSAGWAALAAHGVRTIIDLRNDDERARPGGVVVHCVGGRDRTGQIAMLLLALAGVPPAEIARDYALSAGRLGARYGALGVEDQGPGLATFLAARGTTAATVIVETLGALDVEARLRAGGLTAGEVAALRRRLVGGGPPSAATAD